MRVVRPVLFVVVVGACSHFQPATHPLYAGPTRPTHEVARLSGPIATVDGVEVSRVGTSFSLLPGCHVVELRRRIGEGTTSGAWSAELRYTQYAFRMKAGASYEIEVQLQPGNAAMGSANVGGVLIEAVERDPSGKVVGVVSPVRKPAEVDACLAWDQQDQAVPADPVAAPVAPAAAADAAARVPSAPDAGTSG